MDADPLIDSVLQDMEKRMDTPTIKPVTVRMYPQQQQQQQQQSRAPASFQQQHHAGDEAWSAAAAKQAALYVIAVAILTNPSLVQAAFKYLPAFAAPLAQWATILSILVSVVVVYFLIRYIHM